MGKNALQMYISFFLLICALLLSANLSAAGNTFEQTTLLFQNFTIEDGLSQSSLTSILQDRKGFLWIGSGNGLNRYDGQTFTVFYPQEGDSTSISNSGIWSLFEDSEGYIWVGTTSGLNRFNWHTESFRRFMSIPDDSTTISDNMAWAITEDKNGNIWVGTRNGLNCYNKAEDKFKRYFYRKPGSGDVDKDTDILSLFIDDQNNLWAGTYCGLIKFNISTWHYETLYPDKHDTLSSNCNEIFAINQDKENTIWLGTGDGVFKLIAGKKFVNIPIRDEKIDKISVFDLLITPHSGIWIGSYGAGLFQLDPATGEISQWKNNPYEKNSLAYDSIFHLAQDRSGIIWIATGLGLSKLDLQNLRFRTFLHYPGCNNCLSDNIIWSIFQDHAGSLWFGTDRGGLNCYDPKTKTFKVYKPNPKNPWSINALSISGIAEDRDGRLWLTSDDAGIDVLDRDRKKFTHYQHIEGDSTSLSSDALYCLFIDKKNRVWAGTDAGVLHLYDEEKNNFVSFPISGGQKSRAVWNEIWVITEDSDGNLLLGTEIDGLLRFNPETKQTEHLSDDSGLKELGITSIMSIYQDTASNSIWLGTEGHGLVKYLPQQGKARLFTPADGLPNGMIYGILPENENVSGELKALWLSTDKGLVRFDVKSETMKVYNAGFGLPTDEFDSGAYFKAKDGTMYFGTINGIVYFSPEQIQQDAFCPPVSITSFKLFNKPVKIGSGKDAVLKKSITETKEIVLSYDQNIFTIGFSMLHFRNPEQQKYQYQLAGLDDRWIDLGNKRNFTFTHIPPGKYEFKVRGRNSDGIWSDKVTTLKITLIPPLWGRLWFRMITILSVILLAVVYHKHRTGIVKRRNKTLQRFNDMLNREIDDRKAAQEKIAESLEEKKILLKEIHHRVKNNLQVTSSLLYLQSKNIKDEKAKNYLQESQNRIKSMAMIHEKLYRSENFAHINSRDYIRDLAMYVFRSYTAYRQKISLDVHVEPVNLDLDSAIPCGLILNELISNSIKYAFPDGKEGKIAVSLREKEGNAVELSVKDNGIGIDGNFDPEKSESLGLQLVKSLVNQLEGKYEFKSNGGVEVLITFQTPEFRKRKKKFK